MTILSKITRKIVEESDKVLVGRKNHVTLIVLSIVAEGHVIIEGVPGIAKTLTAKVVAKLLNLKFSRVQCTIDTLPSDIIGTKIYNQKTNEFETRLGPIFTNILLVDEINRASPRTQSALLEAMQERQVTIDGETIVLPRPFVVLATQNPIEHEGTFSLPEAQLDRFYIKLSMDLLDRIELVELLKRGLKKIEKEFENIKPVASINDVVEAGKELEKVYVDNSIYEYIANIVEYSYKHEAVRLGVTPRGALMLLQLAKEFALADERTYVIPDDVKNAAIPILSHRLLIKPEFLAEGYTGEKIVRDILLKIEIPKP